MTRTRTLYFLLVLLRVLVAFTSTSFIHPDEHFQSTEIAAEVVYRFDDAGNGLLRTWEWQGESPCRSIAPIFASSGLAFAALRGLGWHSPSASALFAAPRLVMLLFSFLLDVCIWRTSRSKTAVLLFASSPVTFTFLLRPFSNSLETLLLGIVFALSGISKTAPSRRRLAALGAALAFGVFTRITFAAFALPLVLAIALQLWRSAVYKYSTASSSAFAVILQALPAGFSFLLTSLALALIDTLYFCHHSASPFRLILTPLNLLRYNLSLANLAEHGLHPRYLHVVVNWPMLFGVGLLVVVSASVTSDVKADEKGSSQFQRWVILASFMVPTLILSIQPHQEPRFLVPLIVPLVLLAPHAGFFRRGTARARFLVKAFWTLWLLHSAFFTAFFGYLHQGGLLPALFALNSELRAPASLLGGAAAVEAVFWQTFMPPRHLLLPVVEGGKPSPPAVRVTDIAGASPAALIDTLAAALAAAFRDDTPTVAHPVLLVAPAYAVDQLALACSSTFSTSAAKSAEVAPVCIRPALRGRTYGVHVDTDRLDDLFGASGWGRTGVGVWTVERR
ncbi:hypothetical protein JCM10207_000460 [Rhodosporidiobolus poonsookiae]